MHENLAWATYFDRLNSYQKLIICAAMIGAIEGLQQNDLDDNGIIEYFERILFTEQTSQRKHK